MLTPRDIQTKEFSKAFKGYRECEVDSFLDEITVDYEKIFKENVELKDKVSILSDQVKHYSSIEQTIQKTLIMAQTTAEEVTLNARKKSENILEDAEREYKRKTENGDEELRKIKVEYEKIRKEMMLYKARCKSIVSSQLAMIDSELEEFSFELNNRAEKVIEKANQEECIQNKEIELEKADQIELKESSVTAEAFEAPVEQEGRVDADIKALESETADIHSTARIDISGEKLGILE